MKAKSAELFFTTTLLHWDQHQNNRQMPWKGEKDPYKIWVSEIILQQTRVEQGMDYYYRFIEKYPTVHDLANAPEANVFKLWEGLGYYTRCKNLIATAKFISIELNGQFPVTYEGVLALKGIGPYTAAAISSFAYNLPYAVVDGNVFRVLARFFGINTPTDSTSGKLLFTNLANGLLDVKKPGKYNQAIMDFGAIVCKPKQPICSLCPLQKQCMAYTHSQVALLPVKEKKIIKKTRWLFYIIAEFEGSQYLRLRSQKDIWQNLYEFILIETATPVQLESDDFIKQMQGLFGVGNYAVKHISEIYKQQLTHQTIYGQFIKVDLLKPLSVEGYTPFTLAGMQLLPFPKFITSYLKDKNVSLNLF